MYDVGSLTTLRIIFYVSILFSVGPLSIHLIYLYIWLFYITPTMLIYLFTSYITPGTLTMFQTGPSFLKGIFLYDFDLDLPTPTSSPYSVSFRESRLPDGKPFSPSFPDWINP